MAAQINSDTSQMGLLGGIGNGLQSFADSYMKSKQIQQQNDLNQQYVNLAKQRENAGLLEQGMTSDNQGNVAFTPEQKQIRDVGQQNQIATVMRQQRNNDPASHESESKRKFMKGVFNEVSPGFGDETITDDMSGAQLQEQEPLVGHLMTGLSGMARARIMSDSKYDLMLQKLNQQQGGVEEKLKSQQNLHNEQLDYQQKQHQQQLDFMQKQMDAKYDQVQKQGASKSDLQDVLNQGKKDIADYLNQNKKDITDYMGNAQKDRYANQTDYQNELFQNKMDAAKSDFENRQARAQQQMDMQAQLGKNKVESDQNRIDMQKEMLQNRSDYEKEIGDIKKGLLTQTNEAGQTKDEAKQEQKYQDWKVGALQKLSPMNASIRTGAGDANAQLKRIDRLNQLLKNGDNLNANQTEELAIGLQKVLGSGTGNGAQVEKLLPRSAAGDAEKLFSYFQNNPNLLNQQSFVAPMRDLLNREQSTITSQIKGWQYPQAYSLEHKIKNHGDNGDDEWNEVLRMNHIDPTDYNRYRMTGELEAPQQQAPPSAPKKGGGNGLIQPKAQPKGFFGQLGDSIQSGLQTVFGQHPHDDPAVTWAKQNLNNPKNAAKAKQILKLNGQ